MCSLDRSKSLILCTSASGARGASADVASHSANPHYCCILVRGIAPGTPRPAVVLHRCIGNCTQLSFRDCNPVCHTSPHRLEWSAAIRKEFIVDDANFAAGTFVSQIAGTLVFHGDRVLVSLVGSPAMAGAYSLCVNVTNKTLAAIVALTSFAFPHACGLTARQDRRQLEHLSQSLDRAVVVIIAPALALGVLLAEPFLRLWLGKFSSVELVTAFQILWLAFAIPAFAVPMSYLLAASGGGKLAARFSVLSATVVLSSMPILIPLIGLNGAAFAMLLGMSMASPAFSLAVRRKLRLPHGANRLRFWLGIGCGLVAEIAVLSLFGSTIKTWGDSAVHWRRSLADFLLDARHATATLS